MINIHNLAGRIANLYYDYDYYDFSDSLEVGETMEDAIFKIERVLSGKGGVDSYIDFMDEIIDNIEWEQTEDPSDPDYGEDMLNRAMDIRDDLYRLKDGLQEDTVKQGNGWVNKGKEGTHGKFKTKKGADAQRRAMFAQGYKESLKESKGGMKLLYKNSLGSLWKSVDRFGNVELLVVDDDKAKVVKHLSDYEYIGKKYGDLINMYID